MPLLFITFPNYQSRKRHLNAFKISRRRTFNTAFLPDFTATLKGSVHHFVDQEAANSGDMNMTNITRRFWNDELGNGAVDWAIFGAGVVSLGVALVTALA